MANFIVIDGKKISKSWLKAQARKQAAAENPEVRLNGSLIRETEKAYLIRLFLEGNDEQADVWFPKRFVSVPLKLNRKKIDFEVYVPKWIYDEKCAEIGNIAREN